MKNVSTFLLFVSCFALITSETINDLIENCIQNLGLPAEKMLNAWREQYKDDDDQQHIQLLECVFNKLGIIKKGELNFEEFQSSITHLGAYRFNVTLEHSRQMYEMIDKNSCFSLPKTGNVGLDALHVRNCVIAELVKVV